MSMLVQNRGGGHLCGAQCRVRPVTAPAATTMTALEQLRHAVATLDALVSRRLRQLGIQPDPQIGDVVPASQIAAAFLTPAVDGKPGELVGVLTRDVRTAPEYAPPVSPWAGRPEGRADR